MLLNLREKMHSIWVHVLGSYIHQHNTDTSLMTIVKSCIYRNADPGLGLHLAEIQILTSTLVYTQTARLTRGIQKTVAMKG